MVHRHLPLLALAAALTASLGVDAAEWVAEPSVNLREEYDDNIRLTSVAHDSVWGTVLDPRLQLSRRSELWDLNASGRIRASKYVGEDGLDTTDNFFDIAAKRQLERGSWDFSAAQNNDTTLQNEVLDFDTGLTVNQIDRTQRNLRLAGEYLFTEADWLEASVSYNTVEYDEGAQYGLLDYTYLTPGLRIIHQLDPQTQVFGTLSHSKVDYDLPAPLESENTTDSLQLGAAYDITETWKVSGSVGSRRTDTSGVVAQQVVPPGIDPRLCGTFLDLGGGIFLPINCPTVYVPTDAESTGLVYDASLTREFETGSIKLNATQSVTPSSTGTNTESTRITFSGTRNFSAKLSAQLAVSYYQSSTVGDVTTTSDSDRYRVAPSLSWHMDEDLTLNTGYTYTRVEHNSAGGQTADSNVVFASLGYAWPRMSVSR